MYGCFSIVSVHSFALNDLEQLLKTHSLCIRSVGDELSRVRMDWAVPKSRGAKKYQKGGLSSLDFRVYSSRNNHSSLLVFHIHSILRIPVIL